MSSRPFPPHFVAAVGRAARHIADDARRHTTPGTPAPPSRKAPAALVVGVPDRRTLATLESALGSVHAVAMPPAPALRGLPVPAGGFEVGVALDWLHRLDHPEIGLAALRAVAPHHLLLAAPREPLARMGVTFTTRLLRRGGNQGTGWSAPGFLRFASQAGAVRDVAHPPGWTLVWVRGS